MKTKRKIYLVFTFTFLIFNTTILHSQDLDKKISFRVNNETLADVISRISEKSGLRFSYSPQLIPTERKLSINVRNKSVRFVLEKLFYKEGIEYLVTENQIVLKKSEVGNEPREKDKKQKFTLSGFLRNKTTGEPLIGANIYEKDNFSGTTSNAYGFYSLTLPEGSHFIAVSFVSYIKIEKFVNFDQNQMLSFDLEEIKFEIREVEVFSVNRSELLEQTPVRLTQRQLSMMPGFGGEHDVIKSLQVLPGIQSYGDGSTLFFVRGGNADQNLILIDDAPIFNPSHMFGFFSVIAPDAIREVDIYKGDSPANYGGRLSSVIDIKAKNGNLNRFGFSGNIGFYASGLSVEGPVVKNKGSYFLSGRLSTINWLKFLNTTTTDFNINFYDLNAKINYKINNNNRFFVTFYYGNDEFGRTTQSSIVTYGISWSNLAGILRWNHTFNPKLFSNTTAYYSQYTYYLYTSREQKQYWTSAINNLALKNDMIWYLSPRNTVKAGFEVASHQSNPGNVNFKFTNNQDGLKEVSKYRSMEYVLYAMNEVKIREKLTIKYGLRLPLWQDIGPASVYVFDINHQVIDTIGAKNMETYAWYLRPEPRINICYKITETASFKANYSRNTQFMQVLSTSTSPFTSLEVWAFSGINIKPRVSDQVSAGYVKLMKHFLFSAEGYYKWIENNIDYKDHADMIYNPLIEGELREGKAWSYGIELMLSKQTGNVTGWVAYTWSRAFLQTAGVNGGEEYPAFYDRPHNVSVNLAYNTGRLSLTANWLLMSGATITSPVGFYYLNGYSVPLYGKRNNDRLPLYHRLDISAAYALNSPEKRYQHKIILSLYNAYGRDNPFSINYNRISNDGEFVVPSNMYENNGLIPVALSVAGIIPSINYQFKF